MGLETATYINGLVITNPDGNDGKSQGDDHLRLVKKVLKNTFPNITGAVTATQDDLNKTAIVGNFCFPGMIVAWSGAIGSIPAGWKICNGIGTISTGAPVPDLRGKFLWGSDGTTPNPIGFVSGTANINLSGTVSNTALTVAQMPAHNHIQGYGRNQTTSVTRYGFVETGISTVEDGFGFQSMSLAPLTSTTGQGEPHNHTFTVNAPLANMPPFYTVAYLIKN